MIHCLNKNKRKIEKKLIKGKICSDLMTNNEIMNKTLSKNNKNPKQMAYQCGKNMLKMVETI